MELLLITIIFFIALINADKIIPNKFAQKMSKWL